MLPSGVRGKKRTQPKAPSAASPRKAPNEATAAAPSTGGGAVKQGVYCCGCHESVVEGKPNLPLGRAMCPDCIESVTCYVCSSKGAMEQEEDSLMMCENCRWRGAHYRCVGFKQLPRAPWYCFRCEDYKTRVSQREVMPVLDARVHDEYLATAFPRKRVAVSRQDDAGDFEEEMVGSGGMAPSAGAASSDATLVTYAARPELDAMLRSAVDLHIFGGDEPAAAVAAGLVCRACHEVHEIRCNFCASCGAPMSISKCFTDRVVAEQSLQPAARRHVFISYKGLVAPSIAVYDTGEVRLAQVTTAAGELLSLVRSRDQKTVRWVREENEDHDH